VAWKRFTRSSERNRTGRYYYRGKNRSASSKAATGAKVAGDLTLVEAVVDPHEPPMPPKATLEQGYFGPRVIMRRSTHSRRQTRLGQALIRDADFRCANSTQISEPSLVMKAATCVMFLTSIGNIPNLVHRIMAGGKVLETGRS
jgi:hypothetical protein